MTALLLVILPAIPLIILLGVLLVAAAGRGAPFRRTLKALYMSACLVDMGLHSKDPLHYKDLALATLRPVAFSACIILALMVLCAVAVVILFLMAIF